MGVGEPREMAARRLWNMVGSPLTAASVMPAAFGVCLLERVVSFLGRRRSSRAGRRD